MWGKEVHFWEFGIRGNSNCFDWPLVVQTFNTFPNLSQYEEIRISPLPCKGPRPMKTAKKSKRKIAAFLFKKLKNYCSLNLKIVRFYRLIKL